MKMKLQCTFDLKDIQCGLYIIKNTSQLNTNNPGFASTVAFKVGFNANERGQAYGLISFLTDGMFIKIGDGSKEVLLSHINDNDFRPLRKSEYIDMLNSTEQGFIKY